MAIGATVLEGRVATATMKAVRIHRYGGPEVLAYEEVPTPRPHEDELLVHVHAAAVNPVDWKVREGYMKDLHPHSLPMILGWDISGDVWKIGEDVSRFNVGDEVYSRPDLGRDGGYAEYIVIRESEVALKPRTLDHIQASSIPLTALTAWQSLFDVADLRAGQTVLIHAGAGGVGCMAVQLAKWKGAHVIATASEPNHEFLRNLGADEVIDYNKVRFERVVRDADVILDTMAGETQKRSWLALKKGGIMVSILTPPPKEEAEAHGARAGYVFVRPNAAELAEIAKLIDAGLLRPVVETVLPLSEARRAQEISQSGHARGKIVLKVV